MLLPYSPADKFIIPGDLDIKMFLAIFRPRRCTKHSINFPGSFQQNKLLENGKVVLDYRQSAGFGEAKIYDGPAKKIKKIKMFQPRRYLFWHEAST